MAEWQQPLVHKSLQTMTNNKQNRLSLSLSFSFFYLLKDGLEGTGRDSCTHPCSQLVHEREELVALQLSKTILHLVKDT